MTAMCNKYALIVSVDDAATLQYGVVFCIMVSQVHACIILCNSTFSSIINKLTIKV